MKQITYFLCASIFCLWLASCGNDEEQEPKAIVYAGSVHVIENGATWQEDNFWDDFFIKNIPHETSYSKEKEVLKSYKYISWNDTIVLRVVDGQASLFIDRRGIRPSKYKIQKEMIWTFTPGEYTYEDIVFTVSLDSISALFPYQDSPRFLTELSDGCFIQQVLTGESEKIDTLTATYRASGLVNNYQTTLVSKDTTYTAEGIGVDFAIKLKMVAPIKQDVATLKLQE